MRGGGAKGEEKKGWSRGGSGHGTLRCRYREDSGVGAVLLPTPLALWLRWDSGTSWKKSAGEAKGTQGGGSWKMLGKGAARREMSLSGCQHIAPAWPDTVCPPTPTAVTQDRGNDAGG